MATNYRTQSPVTGEILATFDQATDADVEKALDNAASTFESWRALSIAERAERLRKVATLMDERKEELAMTFATEMGKNVKSGVGEIEYCIEIINYYADNAEAFLADEELDHSDGEAVLRKVPLGPLLGVMPWNYPFYQIARFAAPHMIAGNVVLLKHAEICAQSALNMQKLFDDAGVPAGAYQNLFISHDQIADVIADKRIQGVSLTGSEKAGAIVAAQAGENLKKCVLELGGTDPYIVLDTDDVSSAAALAWKTRMDNMGQACTSNKRLIVMEDIYDQFVAELVSLASAMTKGDPFEPTRTTYGPLSSREAAETLASQIADAVNEGATLHVGGELSDEGAFFSPAVITDIPVGSDAFYTEFFGPVAEVYKVSSDEEAVAIANDSNYGLGGAVFSTDSERARAVASKIETGMIHVNIPQASSAELPFGGIKRSGYGRELGPLGILEFVNKQLFYVAK